MTATSVLTLPPPEKPMRACVAAFLALLVVAPTVGAQTDAPAPAAGSPTDYPALYEALNPAIVKVHADGSTGFDDSSVR
jgi:hypothetical protein